MDIHDRIMDIHDWIINIHNRIMDIHNVSLIYISLMSWGPFHQMSFINISNVMKISFCRDSFSGHQNQFCACLDSIGLVYHMQKL